VISPCNKHNWELNKYQGGSEINQFDECLTWTFGNLLRHDRAHFKGWACHSTRCIAESTHAFVSGHMSFLGEMIATCSPSELSVDIDICAKSAAVCCVRNPGILSLDSGAKSMFGQESTSASLAPFLVLLQFTASYCLLVPAYCLPSQIHHRRTNEAHEE